jgi:hypothetical protein
MILASLLLKPGVTVAVLSDERIIAGEGAAL